MIKRTLFEVNEMVNGQGAKENISINGVSIDTRTVIKDNLFVPIIGERFNGHEFVETAIEQGAVASLWQKNQPNPPKDVPIILVDDTLVALQKLAKKYLDQLQVKVVGITGSNGKTTTKDMVASVLGTTFKVQKTEGNLNNHIGLPLTILRLEEDTEIAVLEMGMSGKGEIEFLSNLAHPDAAIITNIGESHLLDLGSREGIAQAKLEIKAGLDTAGPLIFHGDEPLLNERVDKSEVKSITFGLSESCDYYSTSVQQKNDGTFFTINKYSEHEFFIPVLGKHNVNNAMAAIALADFFGVSVDKINTGFKNLKITGMRTELLKGKDGVHIINDAYNASPTSMKAAIELLEDLKGYQQKFVVLGDMLELGENEKNFHFEVGKSINKDKIDFIFTFGNLAENIAQGAKEHFQEERVFAYKNKEELITQLLSLVNTNDIVLVKGSRGMKLEEVVNALQ